MLPKSFYYLPILISLSILGCGIQTLDDDCTEGKDQCLNGVLYHCISNNHVKFLQAQTICQGKNQDCKDNLACAPREDCVGEANPDGTCKHNDCDHPFYNEDGSCQCVEKCVNGCNPKNGLCNCQERCHDSCDAQGNCILSEGCVNGFAMDGSCRCPEECYNQCTPNGECQCPAACLKTGDSDSDKFKCDSTGYVCCSKNCLYGCNSSNICLCDDTCEHGCNENGKCCTHACKNGCNTHDICLCPGYCVNGCDEYGDCIPQANCVNGSDYRGICICSKECEDGCLSNGDCITPDSCFSDNDCNKDVCAEKACECIDAKCKLIDVNENHMRDKNESGEKLGQPCRTDLDCGVDGFCDSYLDYKCSTRCQKNDCVDNKTDGFHYVCRQDGRCAPDAFVTVWDIPKDNLTFQLPPGKTCNFTVDWGDGKTNTITDCHSDDFTHIYPEPKQYTISIKGKYEGFSLCSLQNNNYIPIVNTNDYLVKIKSFGPVGLTDGAFCHCSNIQTLSEVDIPNAVSLVSLHGMFSASSFNQNIENWDVSHVTLMQTAFKENTSFNQPINKWNVSNVTNMAGVFKGATSFNQPLDAWDVSNVTHMGGMFWEAHNFNQIISTWNTQKVNNMNGMFYHAEAFNQSLTGNKWHVDQVTDMARMFEGASEFDQPLNAWNVSNVKDMSLMFKNASKFNRPLDNWNVGNVQNMSQMFAATSSFNRPLNSWNVGNVQNMNQMFANASAFNKPLNSWNVGKVENMHHLFYKAASFNQDLSNWNVSPGTVIDDIFTYSGLNKTNFCKIYKSDNWKEQPTYNNYTCD